MAAYLLRLFGATLASMVFALLLTLAALRATAPGGGEAEQVASLALAQAFAERVPLLIQALVGVAGILAGGGLLFLGAVCTAAIRTRRRARTPPPDPTSAPQRPQEGREDDYGIRRGRSYHDRLNAARRKSLRTGCDRARPSSCGRSF